jgi:hypothetical protein
LEAGRTSRKYDFTAPYRAFSCHQGQAGARINGKGNIPGKKITRAGQQMMSPALEYGCKMKNAPINPSTDGQ